MSYVIMCNQTMVVVDDRSMTNVNVIDNRYLFHCAWFVNELSHVILTLTGGSRKLSKHNSEN